MRLLDLDTIRQNLFENKNDTSLIFGKTTMGSGGSLPIEPVEYDWEVKDASLNKTFFFSKAKNTKLFFEKMYIRMERMNHHCKFTVDEYTVTVKLQTKMVTDITGQDKELQIYLDEIYYDIEGLEMEIESINRI